MGWAKYLEDIEERLGDNLGGLLHDLDQLRPQLPGSVARKAEAFAQVAQNILHEVQSLLNLATTPDVDLAHELAQSRSAHQNAVARADALEQQARADASRLTRLTDFESQNNRLIAQKAKLGAALEEEKKENARLRKQMSRIRGHGHR